MYLKPSKVSTSTLHDTDGLVLLDIDTVRVLKSTVFAWEDACVWHQTVQQCKWQQFGAEDQIGDNFIRLISCPAWVNEQGVLAKNKDLVKAFGTDNQLEACRIILEKGEMQVRGVEGQAGGGRAEEVDDHAERH